jgi:hypothetical protein
MSNTTTYGIHRIQEANLSGKGGNYSEFNGTTLESATSEIGGFFLENLAGSYEIAGVILLAAVGYGFWTQNVPTDVQATVMIPLFIVLASGGFIPGGEGLLFGMLVGLAAVVIFGAFNFIS